MADLAIVMPNGDDYRPHGDAVIEHVRQRAPGQLKPQAIRTKDLRVDNTLHTSVLLSLFTDRRADRRDIDRDASLADGPLRGCWIDDLLPAGDRWGSRLWTIRSGKAIASTLRRAEFYAREALDWMRVQGIADRIIAEARFHEVRSDRIILKVQLFRGAQKLYDSIWGVTLAA